LQNNTVDYVIATEIIEHLVNPLHMLSESRRVLRRNGRIFLTSPNVAKSSAWIKLLLGRSNLDPLNKSHIYMHTKWRGHVRLFSKEELEMMLLDSGFRVLESRTYPGDYGSFRGNWIRKIDFSIRIFFEFFMPWTKPGLLIIGEKST